MRKTTEEFAEELRKDDYPYANAIAFIRGAAYALDGDDFKAETERILNALDTVNQERLVADRAWLDSLKQQS